MELIYNYSNQASKFLKKHQELKEKFQINIKYFFSGAQNIDIKTVKGYKDLYRMRINDYRVIYKVENEEIIIINILFADNRGEIYKKIKKK